MNIFFITPKINLSGGGSNSNTDLRIRTLKSKGYNVKVVTIFSQYNKLSEKNPYEIIPYYKKPRLWIFLNFFIFKILKKYQKEADLFYIDGPQFLWGGGLYKIFGKKPVIMHLNVLPYAILEHGTRLYADENTKTSLFKKIKFWIRSKIGGYIDIFFAKKIDCLTCTSPTIKEQCVNFGFSKNNLEILPEFIDTEMFIQTKREKTVKKDKKHLLYIGRLVPCKGVDLLIRAVDCLKDKNIVLDIVGDGPELLRLKNLTKKLSLDKQINFHGWVKREMLGEIYDQADVFVHPARWAEPLGITIVEATAVGLPVIVPQISGSAWAAGLAGLKFENGNMEDLTEKIKIILDDEKLYKELQNHTVKETERMDYKKWIGKFEDLIEEFIAIAENTPSALRRG